MPFESKGETQQNLGRSQARISRQKKLTMLTKKDRLKLAKAAAKNIVEGTIKRNQEIRKRQSTDSSN
jgi:hypothetical protein